VVEPLSIDKFLIRTQERCEWFICALPISTNDALVHELVAYNWCVNNCGAEWVMLPRREHAVFYFRDGDDCIPFQIRFDADFIGREIFVGAPAMYGHHAH
jgi:hypothetical protein